MNTFQFQYLQFKQDSLPSQSQEISEFYELACRVLKHTSNNNDKYDFYSYFSSHPNLLTHCSICSCILVGQAERSPMRAEMNIIIYVNDNYSNLLPFLKKCSQACLSLSSYRE